MKRMNGKRNANHETENDDSVSDDSKRLRRRRQRQMGNDNAANSYLTRINTTDLALTAPGKVQGTTTSTHSIASIGENVYLPDYVREHNTTLTFPEKVRFLSLPFVWALHRRNESPFLTIFFCFIVDAHTNAC